MIFQLQITVQSIEEAERILASLKYSADPAVVQQVEDQTQRILACAEQVAQHVNPAAPDDKPKNPRGRPRRQVADALPEPAAPVAEATATPEAEVEAPVPQTYTRDDIRKALMDLQAKTPGDMTGALAMLEKFNAGRVSEVQDADFAKFIDACKAA